MTPVSPEVVTAGEVRNGLEALGLLFLAAKHEFGRESILTLSFLLAGFL